MSRVQHKTQITFYSIVFLYSAPCSVWSTVCSETTVNNYQRRLPEIPEQQRPQPVTCLPLRTTWFRSQRLNQTYQFLWADEAAVLSSPSEVLRLVSLAVRSDQTHFLLSPGPPYWEVPSPAVTSCVWEHKTLRVVQNLSILLF